MIKDAKNNSQINANLNKVFNHLREFQKINPRYLWAQKLIIEGNYDVFWGIIDDMRNLYKNKISN